MADSEDVLEGVPEMPEGKIPIQPPPNQAEAAGIGNVLAMVIPMMGSMGVMIFMAISQASAGGGQGRNPMMLMMAGGMVFAMVAMVGFNVYRQVSQHRQKVKTLRGEYLAYLAETRQTVRNVADRQRAFVNWALPAPEALVAVAEQGERVWEREPGVEMLNARVGVSEQGLAMELLPPDLPPMANPDIVCLSAMTRFIETHRNLDSVAFGVPLEDYSHIELAGRHDDTIGIARLIMTHLATFVSPTYLRIAVLCSPDRLPEWEWVKWLPHAGSTVESDAVGPARMVVTEAVDLLDLLGSDVVDRPAFAPRDDLTPWPHVLLVCDGAEFPASTQLGSPEGAVGVTTINLHEKWGPLTSPSTVRLLVHPAAKGETRGVLEVNLFSHQAIVGEWERVGQAQAEAIARRLTPFASDEGAKESETPVGRSDVKRTVDLLELLHLGDIRDFDPEQSWVRRVGRNRLRVPFGVTPEGIPVLLDIKEAAQQGMGPHGLLIGATGSGKSEVLRTLVLALALTHSPEQLNFVLVDFKGGATFAGMSNLPHVSAMISNLESELSLVDRMQDALKGEMVRRQEVLRDAGNYANVTDYEADRVAGKHSFPPMPALFIILDEFSELLTAKPEFADLFVAIGRLGRSLSIHLLLASQRLETSRMRGLESHLSYRVGLKTFSASESREVLGVPDAYELPSLPGSGYLMPGTDELIRFRASYVAAPPPPRTVASTQMSTAGTPDRQIKVLPFSLAPVLTREEPGAPQASTGQAMVLPEDAQWAEMSELDIAVAKMAGKGIPAHQVWLPPLDVPDTFDQLMPDLAPVEGLGYVSRQWRERGSLVFPMGTRDLPLEQRRDVLTFDLSGAAGNFAVVGGPLTGKSMTLRSLVMSLSLIYTPQEVQFYIIDLGGGTFASFTDAPHVAAVATRDTDEILTRMIAEIRGIIEDRERYFREHRIDSIETYRRGRAEGRYDDGYGDVFLVVDNWASLKADFDDLDMTIGTMLSRALTFGVHLVVATSRWSDFRMQVADMLGSKLELKIGDFRDSALDRNVQKQIPGARPGRGVSMSKHHVLVGLPRADGDPDPTTVTEGVAATLQMIRAALPAGPGPKLRLLPTKITAAQIAQLPGADAPVQGPAPALMLGIEESRLGPYRFDPNSEQHLYLFGDSKSGKTTFLRSLAREIMARNTPNQARIISIDLRRASLGVVPPEYSLDYFTRVEDVAASMRELADFFKMRLPGDDVTAEQLATRSWWSGPEVWVLVDDYDLVVTSEGNPLMPLQPLLSQAGDVGLHLVLTRRMGGVSRALYERVLQTLIDLGTTGIMLSGNPDEGQVIGRIKPVRAVPGRAIVVSREEGVFRAQLAYSDPVR